MSDNYGSRCPICRAKWKITTFGAKVWKDCLECEDTAENLMKKAKDDTPAKKYEGSDWMWEEDLAAYTGVDSGGTFPRDYNMPKVNPDADDVDYDDDWDDIPPF